MSLPYRIELIMDSDEEGYAALIPELRGCITVGRTISDAITNIEDAKKAWLSSAIENDDPIPEPKDTARRPTSTT